MFINMRLAGINDTVNYIILTVIGLLVTGATGWVWHRTDRISLKAVTMCTGTFLIIPYFLQYDLMILSIPLVLFSYDLIEYGSRPIDFLLLLVLWATPVLDGVFVIWMNVHICPFILMALMIDVVARVKLQRETVCGESRVGGMPAPNSDLGEPERRFSVSEYRE